MCVNKVSLVNVKQVNRVKEGSVVICENCDPSAVVHEIGKYCKDLLSDTYILGESGFLISLDSKSRLGESTP